MTKADNLLPCALIIAPKTGHGIVRVLMGLVRLVSIDPLHVLEVFPETPAVIPPQETRYVKTVGAMKLQVEFY